MYNNTYNISASAPQCRVHNDFSMYKTGGFREGGKETMVPELGPLECKKTF